MFVLVVQMVVLIHCLTGELDSELLKDLDVHIGQHDRRVRLASLQFRELGESEPRLGARGSAG